MTSLLPKALNRNVLLATLWMVVMLKLIVIWKAWAWSNVEASQTQLAVQLH